MKPNKRLFKMNDKHYITLYGSGAVVSETTPIPRKIHSSVKFMADCRIHNMVVEGMKLQRIFSDPICEYYDNHPNMTLDELSSIMGKTVSKLRQILKGG